MIRSPTKTNEDAALKTIGNGDELKNLQSTPTEQKQPAHSDTKTSFFSELLGFNPHEGNIEALGAENAIKLETPFQKFILFVSHDQEPSSDDKKLLKPLYGKKVDEIKKTLNDKKLFENIEIKQDTNYVINKHARLNPLSNEFYEVAVKYSFSLSLSNRASASRVEDSMRKFFDCFCYLHALRFYVA